MPRLNARFALMVSLAGVMAGPLAHAQQPKAQPTNEAQPQDATVEDECVAAFDSAQTLRKKLELRAAKTQLELCARAACPSIIASDCGRWLTEVQTELPSIIIAVKDEHGKDTSTR